MDTRRRNLALALAVAMSMMICPPLAHAKKGEIEPGPAVISKKERALESDPAQGIEHAVILVEETSRAEDKGSGTKTTFHLRAKILSNEGRDLANIEIPVLRKGGKLKQFWGRTILPDGTVHELRKDDLDRQLVIGVKRSGVEAAKAALPGVVPGCVADRFSIERALALFNLQVDVDRYEDLRTFIAEVERLDRTQLSFTRSDTSR